MSFDVVMLTSAHPALDDRIFYREAKTLANAGYTVCVVGRHPESEVVDGVSIRALPSPCNRLQRLLSGPTILKMALELDSRLYIIHDPELILVAFILRSLGKKVVYDAHENLPAQILQKEWIVPPIRQALVPVVAAVEWIAARVLNGVIAAVPAIQMRFPKSRTELVRNFPTRSALATLAEGVPLEQRRDIVIYTGGLSRVRGIGELVEAFRGLDDKELWLVGSFDDREYQRKITCSLPGNVAWLGLKSHDEVLKMYRFAKLGALLLYPTPNHRCALPVKLFEYFGAGLPVISSDFPEYRELVEGCGTQVNPYDVGAIRVAICKLLDDAAALAEMSARARDRVVNCFFWEDEGERLVKFCTRLMSEPRVEARRQLVH